VDPLKLDSQGLVFLGRFKANIRLPRSPIPQATMRPVVIVLAKVTGDAFPRFLQVPVFGQSHFLLFQAAMKALDVAVSFRVVMRRAAMVIPNRARLFRKSVDVNWVPLPVVRVKPASRLPAGGRSKTARSTTAGASFGPATVRQVPAHDLPPAAVDHRDRIDPPYRPSLAGRAGRLAINRAAPRRDSRSQSPASYDLPTGR